MPAIQRIVDIERPVETVFQAVTTSDRISAWIPTIQRAFISSAGSTGIGTTFVEESTLLRHHSDYWHDLRA